MARVGIVFGLLLCGLTYAALVATNHKSPIQFIPMMIGIPTLFCGVVALNPHRRYQSMQAAAVLALSGTIVGCSRSAVWLFDWMRNEPYDAYTAPVNLALMVVSGLFLLLCITSMIQDRRRRHAQRSPSEPLPKVSASINSESR